MRNLLNILALGMWLVAALPCKGEDAAKVYEVGVDESNIRINVMTYMIEPISAPVNIRSIRDNENWISIGDHRRFRPEEIRDQRITMHFRMRVTSSMFIYLNYGWASAFNYNKFFILDNSGEELSARILHKNMLLVEAYVPAGLYDVYFVAEPDSYSSIYADLSVMNSAYISNSAMLHNSLNFVIFGVGLSFVFFNLSMFILHRKSYFIYYVGYSSSILWLLMVGRGVLPLGHSSIWNFALVVCCLFTVLMSSSVLRLGEYHPRLLRTMYVCLYAAAFLMFSRYLFKIDVLRIIGMFVGAGCLTLSVYAAVRRMQAGYIPATFFAMGWGVLAVGYIVSLLSFYFVSIEGLSWSSYIAYCLESMLFAVALAYRTRDSEQRAVKDKLHALSQLQKVVYPHQMRQIASGGQLESSMPTTSGRACVISFDIIGSSKIKHIRDKEFFRNVFTRCNAIMAEGYDGNHLKANAYRVKEMGDGFLCSVGYPFQSMTVNPTNEAIDLARRYAKVLAEEATILHSETPIACGIGIALDTLTGFYPEAGTKEYDIFGPALILATRYESMRKTLFEAEKGRSVLIIQEVVYQSLDPSHRARFISMDLKELGIVVRDDPAATKLYYQFLDQKVVEEGKPDTFLKAV